MKRAPLPFILPLAAILFVVIFGGGLGVSYILLAKTGLEQWGAVIIGLLLVLGVPTVAAFLTMPKGMPIQEGATAASAPPTMPRHIPMKRMPLPFILPLAAILFVVIFGGGLGVSYIFLAKTGLEQWGAVIIGLLLVLGVPTVGAFLTAPRH